MGRNDIEQQPGAAMQSVVLFPAKQPGISLKKCQGKTDRPASRPVSGLTFSLAYVPDRHPLYFMAISAAA